VGSRFRYASCPTTISLFFLTPECETWVPLGPHNQAHGRPRQVGPTYQMTRRSVTGPNRPSWRPTRPPEDLLEDSPDDLIHHNLKTGYKTRPRWISPKADRWDMARCVM
jgi:hypothetical protein